MVTIDLTTIGLVLTGVNLIILIITLCAMKKFSNLVEEIKSDLENMLEESND